MKPYFFLLFSFVLFSSCKKKAETKVQNGLWRVEMATKGGSLPFGISIKTNADSVSYQVLVHNGTEALEMDKSYFRNDSLVIPMGIFDAELVAKVSDKNMNGIWRKKRANGTFVTSTFTAKKDEKQRFVPESEISTRKIAEKYSVQFFSEKDTSDAVGVFSQKGNLVQGTFLTPTGDYRYLAGNVVGDSVFLSAYDGTHAFLFKAVIEEKGLSGDFYSNANSHQKWVAKTDAKATLPDVHKLTYLKKGEKGIHFSFPNTKMQSVSLEDKRFENKVVVIQILGSWCPNCMDETRFLVPFYEKNKQRGLEIVGLSFEKSTDPKIAMPKIEFMKQRLNMPYEVLLAGFASGDSASKALPMLNRVMGFPTTIVLDRKKQVREIHTGFSGPGTGKYYDEYVADFTRLMDKLLEEN